MPYDDPLYIAAKWGSLLGASGGPVPDDLNDPAARDQYEYWALQELKNGPAEAQQVYANVLRDEEVLRAFTETLWEDD